MKFQSVLPHPGSELSAIFLLDSLVFEKSTNFFQLVGPVGNRFNRFCQVALFYKHNGLFQPVLPHLNSELSAAFFCSIPYSSRNLLVKFQNFSQLVGPVGNWFNRFCQATLFYKHIVLFQLVLPHPASELSTIFLLNSLFFKESTGKVS